MQLELPCNIKFFLVISAAIFAVQIFFCGKDDLTALRREPRVSLLFLSSTLTLSSKRLFKNLFMLSVRISSYGCTREVWRARKIRKSSSRRSREQF